MSWRYPFTVVDTHCHAGLRKYEPVEAIIDQMFRTGVDQAVLVQHMGEYDNRYHVECTQRFPERLVTAVLVDVTRPDAPETLAYWANQPGVRGLRLLCTDPEPVWAKADELRLVVTLRGTSAEFASTEVRRRIHAYPQATFCVEHLGLPGPEETAPYATYRAALKLSEIENVYLKVSGEYYTSKQTYPYRDVTPILDLAFAAFGPRRMMWGSDFPPVSSREGYRNTLALMEALYPGLSTHERSWLMGRTAQRVWRLPS